LQTLHIKRRVQSDIVSLKTSVFNVIPLQAQGRQRMSSYSWLVVFVFSNCSV